MNKLADILAELKRRQVFRVAAAYGGVAFIISEIVANTFGDFGISVYVNRAIYILLILGFPVAIALGWIYDITEKGVVRTKSKREAEAKAPHPLVGNKTLAVIAMLAIIVAVWALLRGPSVLKDSSVVSIGVIPFNPISADITSDEYADGVTSEIISELASIKDLHVFANTTMFTFKGLGKTPKTIGEELDADVLLEGEIWRSGETVRINAQLIDPRTQGHLWNDKYDREDDPSQILEIVSDVAQEVVEALRIQLTPQEEERLVSAPQVNPEALEYYLRGNVTLGLYGQENIMNTVDMFEKAVELDPTFTAAWAKLTVAHLKMYWTGDDTEERRTRAKGALDRAQTLDPDMPEVLWAHGYYYYWGFRDYDNALKQFNIALEKQPNNSDIHAAIGYINRRLGSWEAAVASLRRAAELDPLSYDRCYELILTYTATRNWVEVERYADRCIFIAPEALFGYYSKAIMHLRSEGDIEKALRIIEEAPVVFDPSEVRVLLSLRLFIEILARDYHKALDILETDTVDWYLQKANIYWYMGQLEQAAAYYDSARVGQEELVKSNPDDYTAHWNLGVIYAGLGRREEAIREGQRAVEIMPISEDAFDGPTQVLWLAVIYTMVGEQDAAIDRLELLLSIPCNLTVALLELDPNWDPLREHPRFIALLEKYDEL